MNGSLISFCLVPNFSAKTIYYYGPFYLIIKLNLYKETKLYNKIIKRIKMVKVLGYSNELLKYITFLFSKVQPNCSNVINFVK